MHEKEKKLKQSVNNVKSEWKDLSGTAASGHNFDEWSACLVETARAFVKQFRPVGEEGTHLYLKRQAEMREQGEG